MQNTLSHCISPHSFSSSSIHLTLLNSCLLILSQCILTLTQLILKMLFTLVYSAHFHKDVDLKYIGKTASSPLLYPISISKQQNRASQKTSGNERDRQSGYCAESQLVKPPFGPLLLSMIIYPVCQYGQTEDLVVLVYIFFCFCFQTTQQA